MIQRTWCFLLLLFSCLAASAQVEENVVFPTNEFIYTNECNPYPMVDDAAIAAIDRDSLLNVADFGVIGNGSNNDNTAFVNAVNAFNSSPKYKGFLIPIGKTVMLDRLNTFNINKDCIVFQDGNIKMMNKKRYSALQFDYPDNQVTHQFLWIANGTGVLDGNQYNQIWPTNSHGGEYDAPFVEAHGRFLGVKAAKFVMFYRVRMVNSVMDGPTAESCQLAVFAHSKATDGAPFRYEDVQDQGTYFKSTRVGLKTTYFINDTTDGGSIGLHVSYPTKSPMDTSTLTVAINCVMINHFQNPLHIEDCYKNFVINCKATSDPDAAAFPSIHFSNRTALAYLENNQFINQRVNFNNAASLRLGIVKNCSFKADVGSGAGEGLEFFVWNATHVVNCALIGTTDTSLIKANYVLRNLITDWGSKQYAVKGASIVAGTRFTNGSKVMSLANGGKKYDNTYVSASGSNDTPSGNWQAPFQSRINIRNLQGDIIKTLTAN